MRYEAVRLFVDRARLRLPNFELTQENAGAVARVCRKLDGIPLAIELGHGEDGGTGGGAGSPEARSLPRCAQGCQPDREPRQQTLRATLDWSHNLLSEAERALFRRLSVFAGGWTWRRRRRCAPKVPSSRTISWISSVGWWTSRSWWPGRARAGRCVTGCSGPSASTPGRSWRRAGKPMRCGPTRRFLPRPGRRSRTGAGRSGAEALGGALEGEHDNMRATLSWVLERGKAELGLRLVRRSGGSGTSEATSARGSGGWSGHSRAVTRRSPVRVKALEGMGC